jgi:hypothetical protein
MNTNTRSNRSFPIAQSVDSLKIQTRILRRFHHENRDLTADATYSMFANTIVREAETDNTYTFGLRSTAHMVADLYGMKNEVYDRALGVSTNLAYMQLYCNEGDVVESEIVERLAMIGFRLVAHDRLVDTMKPPLYDATEPVWTEADRCPDPDCGNYTCDHRSRQVHCEECATGSCTNCNAFRQFHGISEATHRAQRKLASHNRL